MPSELGAEKPGRIRNEAQAPREQRATLREGRKQGSGQPAQNSGVERVRCQPRGRAPGSSLRPHDPRRRSVQRISAHGAMHQAVRRRGQPSRRTKKDQGCHAGPAGCPLPRGGADGRAAPHPTESGESLRGGRRAHSMTKPKSRAMSARPGARGDKRRRRRGAVCRPKTGQK